MVNKIFSKQLVTAIAVAVLGTFKSQIAAAASFQEIGDLPGGIFLSVALDISGDGTVVAGTSVAGTSTIDLALIGEATLWTENTGQVLLGDLPGGEVLGGAFGLSEDGSVIVGLSSSEASASDGDSIIDTLEAFRWTAETGSVALGDLPGGSYSSVASAISADGSIVVGDSSTDSGREAFRWTAETGMVGLGDLPGGNFSSLASDISGDGSIIIGSSNSTFGDEVFRWTAETGMVGLGDLPGGDFFSRSADVSADGSVIVGRSSSADSSASGNPVTNISNTEAFRWTAETGMVGLGDLPGGDFFSRAYSVSGDGSVVVGESESSSGLEAFIWDTSNGMRSLKDILIDDFDLDLNDWTLGAAFGVSDDGLTIVGDGINPEGNPEGWVARLESNSIPEPSFTWSALILVGIFAISSPLKRKY